MRDHGFLYSDGKMTTFDVPGAEGTVADYMGPNNLIAGFYFDSSEVAHGFVRAPDGSFTTISAPGAGSVPEQGQGTYVAGDNPGGTVTGYYVDSSNVSHGFTATIPFPSS
jgi:hypothetical protein